MACSAESTARPAPGVATSTSVADIVTPSATPSSIVTVASPTLTSEVTVGGDVPTSSAEVRVGKILSDLQTENRPEGTVISLPEVVLFDFGQAELKPAARQTLAKVAEVIAFYADAKVEVLGHTDSKGSDAYNRDLSQRRAAAVVTALSSAPGIGKTRLQAKGLGKTQPVAANTNPDGSDNPRGRQQNRRVEIVLQGVRR
jgi:outer membrane protein OmpA-like peptidoglycan-associated protein